MLRGSARGLLKTGRICELVDTDFFVGDVSDRVATQVFGLITQEQLLSLAGGRVSPRDDLFQDLMNFLVTLGWKGMRSCPRDEDIQSMYGDYTKRDLGCFGRLLERILSYSFPEIIYQAPADFESWGVDVFFRHKNKKYAVQIKHNDDGGMTKARKKMWKNHSEMFEMSLNFSRCKFTPDGYLGVRFLPEFLPTGKTGPNDTPPAELQTPQKLVKHLPSYLAGEMNVLNTFIEQLPPILDVIGAEKSGVLPNIVIEEGNGATKYKVTNNEGKTMVVVYHFHMF